MRRSPSHIRHLLPAVLPMNEFTSFDHENGHLLQSRTATTLLQHALPLDLPPLYQPQHRASI